MNDQVLEAARFAVHREMVSSRNPTPGSVAAAAIKAADAHRAEAVREAVRALELDAQRYGVFPSPQGGIRLRASRAALLRLVGAEDSE